mgnify:CR=1 FL=1
MLALAGCIVTIDVIGWQTAIAQTILDRGADSVLALKGNQPATEQAVQTLVAHAQARDFCEVAHARHETLAQGHGPIERRQVWRITEPQYVVYANEGARWPELRALGMVVAERTVGERTTRAAIRPRISPQGRISPSAIPNRAMTSWSCRFIAVSNPGPLR